MLSTRSMKSAFTETEETSSHSSSVSDSFLTSVSCDTLKYRLLYSGAVPLSRCQVSAFTYT